MSSIHGTNDFIRHLFPPLILVAIRRCFLYRQDIVDHQDALFGPSFQESMCGHGSKIGNIFISKKFLVNIQQGGWDPDALADGKAKSMGLVGSMVGVYLFNYFGCIQVSEEMLRSTLSNMHSWNTHTHTHTHTQVVSSGVRTYLDRQ